jgi:hypothetical protein
VPADRVPHHHAGPCLNEFRKLHKPDFSKVRPGIAWRAHAGAKGTKGFHRGCRSSPALQNLAPFSDKKNPPPLLCGLLHCEWEPSTIE